MFLKKGMERTIANQRRESEKDQLKWQAKGRKVV
jgi:hypothetical protein